MEADRYYRIEEVDRDGNRTFSDEIMVSRKASGCKPQSQQTVPMPVTQDCILNQETNC